MKKRKRILVSPLNWGLGHATRCIPLIKTLEKYDAEVIIAAEGNALHLLKREFPKKQFIALPPFEIKYFSHTSFLFSIGLQLPKLYQSIRRDRKILDGLIENFRLDGVISDNRYGMYAAKIPSLIISHQLNPFSSFLQSFLRIRIKKLIENFDFCWIPDNSGEENLSGDLSHPVQLSIPTFYLGFLSRFDPPNPSEKTKIERPLMVILSGPEPSRSFLEKKIIGQLAEISQETLLVRGLPSEKTQQPAVPSNLKMINHLSSQEMRAEILRSELLICRSGYSSVMDLAVLGKKALLIPSPGQSEQEYIANHLFHKKRFYSVQEKHLDLKRDIKVAKDFNRGEISNKNAHLEKAVESFLATCES